MADDQLAGAWGFAGFMLAELIGLRDVGVAFRALAPSVVSLLELLCALPFFFSTLLLALASYADAINRAAQWADDQAVSDELVVRAGHLAHPSFLPYL